MYIWKIDEEISNQSNSIILWGIANSPAWIFVQYVETPCCKLKSKIEKVIKEKSNIRYDFDLSIFIKWI